MKRLLSIFVAATIVFAMSDKALAIDINAGLISGNAEAKTTCPEVCSGLVWNGEWKTTQEGVMSVCGTTAGVDIPVGPIWNNSGAQTKCQAQLPKVTWNGNWTTTVPNKMSVCGCNPPTPKINAAYINTQPAPFGGLTQSIATTYGATKFTRFNIMGLSFCPSSGCTSSSEKANPIYWGSAQALSDAWKAPASMQSAISVIQDLNPNNDKELFVSIVGSQTATYFEGLSTEKITPDAAVCKSGGSGVGNVNCAIFYLDKFMSAYGLTGLDIDMENGPSKGFENLLVGLASSSDFLNKYHVSFAPYVDNFGTGCAPPIGANLQEGSCVFQDNNIENYIAGRQYYSGGLQCMGADEKAVKQPDFVKNTLTSELEGASSTTCSSGDTLTLGAKSMVIGLSPYSVLGNQFPHGRGYPNTCQYYYERGYPNCAELMKGVIKKYPDLGGTFVWTIGLIDPAFYACQMDNALNGNSNDCGTPQPIPGDAGYCGPTQPENCKHPDTGS